MRFSIDVGGEHELKLHQAILLYRNEQASRHMATVHGIAQSQCGAPVLCSQSNESINPSRVPGLRRMNCWCKD